MTKVLARYDPDRHALRRYDPKSDSSRVVGPDYVPAERADPMAALGALRKSLSASGTPSPRKKQSKKPSDAGKRTTPFQRLMQRLRDEHGMDIPQDVVCYRTRSGYWQRSQGAASWIALDAERREYVLGYRPVVELLKAEKLDTAPGLLSGTVEVDIS